MHKSEVKDAASIWGWLSCWFWLNMCVYLCVVFFRYYLRPCSPRRCIKVLQNLKVIGTQILWICIEARYFPSLDPSKKLPNTLPVWLVVFFSLDWQARLNPKSIPARDLYGCFEEAMKIELSIVASICVCGKSQHQLPPKKLKTCSFEWVYSWFTLVCEQAEVKSEMIHTHGNFCDEHEWDPPETFGNSQVMAYIGIPTDTNHQHSALANAALRTHRVATASGVSGMGGWHCCSALPRVCSKSDGGASWTAGDSGDP